MNYDEFINNILESRGRFACGDEYHERHHIIPRCMGGTDDKNNLIDLFAKEHFEAHRMLALENPENSSLVTAWWMMAHVNGANQKRIEVSAKEYEEAKRAFSEMRKGKELPEYVKDKMSKALKGRIISEETKQKMSIARKGKKHSEETKQKIKKSLIGRTLSEETKQKIGEYSKKRRHSKETKRKMSESRGRSVLCVETGVTYKSLQEAENKTGISYRGISNVLNGRQKTAGGYHWKSIDESYIRKFSEETRRKLSEARKDNGNKPVRCIETNVVYKSISFASEKLGIRNTSISKVCNGERKTAGGYHWEFVEEKNEISSIEL